MKFQGRGMPAPIDKLYTRAYKGDPERAYEFRNLLTHFTGGASCISLHPLVTHRQLLFVLAAAHAAIQQNGLGVLFTIYNELPHFMAATATNLGVKLQFTKTEVDLLAASTSPIGGASDAHLLIVPITLCTESLVATFAQRMANRISWVGFAEAQTMHPQSTRYEPLYAAVRKVHRTHWQKIPVLLSCEPMTLDEYKYIVSLFPLTVAEAMPTTRLDRIYAHIEHPDYTYQLAWLVRYLQTTPAQKFVSCATKADARRLHHWLEKNALPAVVCDDSDLQTREMTQRYISENADCTVLTCGAPPVWLNTTACKTVIHYQLPQLLTTYLLEASAVGTIDAKIQYYTLATTAAVTTPVRDTTDRLANSHLQELKRFVDEHPNGVSFHSILNNILMSERLARMGLAHLVQHQCITTTAEKKYIPGNNAWNAAKFGIAPTTKARLDSILLETVFRASKCVSQGISIGLSEADPQPCGRCLQCLAQPSQNTPDQNILVRAMSFVKDDFVTLTPHKKWPAGVHIDKTNTIPDEYRAEEGKALCLQHDAYYGSLIGSHRETIHPELIEASVSLLRQWLRRYLEDKKLLTA